MSPVPPSADIIKVLNDDDALVLSKKTLSCGAISSLRIQVTNKARRQSAIVVLRRSKDSRADFLAISLRVDEDRPAIR